MKSSLIYISEIVHPSAPLISSKKIPAFSLAENLYTIHTRLSEFHPQFDTQRRCLNREAVGKFK